MRNTRKRIMEALMALALIPAGASAYLVKSPVPGTVSLTSAGYTGVVDLSSGYCNYWGIAAPLAGLLYWDVTIRTTGIVCYGSGSGNQNEVKHIFANGWTFRAWNFIQTNLSYDRTCDRCIIGNEGGTGLVTGPRIRLQYDRSGTRDASWYAGYIVPGQRVGLGETIGSLE